MFGVCGGLRRASLSPATAMYIDNVCTVPDCARGHLSTGAF